MKILLSVVLFATLLMVAQVVNLSVIQPTTSETDKTSSQTTPPFTSSETEKQPPIPDNFQTRSNGEAVRFFGRVYVDIDNEDKSIAGDRYLVEIMSGDSLKQELDDISGYVVINYLRPEIKISRYPQVFHTEYNAENDWYTVKHIAPVVID